ncbi:MAG: outer membrane beta-barrel protein [Candidatus Pseudobacter hemicellulosilyticus]|uniref:Outer membrane beta-barrel protein n=1 Tax=Candidatus Pseudobacter hemicellulosilyticus TaxID=3121375 RepID=A0AAJ5WUL0_9BACT|nr:MAG: outer membrane beta-barrel protein [Pseudobacter sp.]
MKKFLTLFFTVACVTAVTAQDSTAVEPTPVASTTKTTKAPKAKKDWSQVNLGRRANDHFMLQLGYNAWSSMPDTINTKGLPRTFNMYFMFDFPFKSDPRWSVGIGAGLGTDNMFFDKTDIDITGRKANTLGFYNVSDTNHFKKYKLATTFAEIPVELRYVLNPENSNKSWKLAVGAKIGTLLSAQTKGKNLQNRAGNTINAYTDKEKSKRYFNGTRLAATLRAGYGNLGLWGSYQINSFIKEGQGPDVRPFQIGISLSGL